MSKDPDATLRGKQGRSSEGDGAGAGAGLFSQASSTGELMSGILTDVSKLVRMELDLAKQELTEIVRTNIRAAALLALSVILAVLIVPMLVLTAIEVLAIWLPRWGATAIMTGAIIGLSAAVFFVAKSKLGSKLKPDLTIRSLRRNTNEREL